MVRRCVVGGCSNVRNEKVALHQYPTDASLWPAWDRFIRKTRKDFDKGHAKTIVCSDHFNEDDFENLMKWQLGGSKSLFLKRTAIPSRKKRGLVVSAETVDQPTSGPGKKPRKNRALLAMKLQMAREHFIGGETTQDHPDPTCADKIVHGAKQKDVFPSGTTVEGPSANRERKITTACYSDLTFFKKRERKVTTIGDTGMTLLKNLLTKRNTEITVAGNTDVTPPAKRQRKVIIWDTSMTSAEQARRTNDMKAICSMKGNRKCKAEDYLLETSSSARIGSPKKKMPDITAGDAVVPDFLEIKKEPTDIENQPNPEELLTARETFHDIKPIFLVKVEPESSHTNSQHHEYVCAPCVEEVSHTIKTEVFDTEGEIKMELPLLSRQHFCGVRPLFLCRAVSKSEFGCAHSEQYENKNIEGAEETFRIELNPDWLPDDEQNRHPTC